MGCLVDTWPKILKSNYEKYGDNRKAMRYKHYGVWQAYTWKDYYLDVRYLALGLTGLGFESGDKLLIMGDNAPQWYCGELAAQANHGASVGVFSDLTVPEIRYIAENSEVRFAMVQDQEQVDKLLQLKNSLPLLTKIIYWNYKGLAHYTDPALIRYGQVLDLGRKHEEAHPGFFEKNLETGKAEDVCSLVYTSGTTGPAPKAAVHTYKTMRASVDNYLRLDPWRDSDDLVPHLPPAWITGQWSGIGCHLLSACTLNFAEEPETQLRDTKEIGPSIVLYGARVWEGLAAMLQARMLGVDTIKRMAWGLFMPVGYKMADLRFRKVKPGLATRLLYLLGNAFLFGAFRRSLGLARARICYSTDAVIGPDTVRFFQALNLPLKSVYGTTEGGPLTGAANDDIRPDTIGRPFEGAELMITKESEIVYRQQGTFIGYYGDLQATAEVLKDGWFYSGDKGLLGEDGHLLFLDRVGSLVEMASGDRLTPQLIESRLRFSPYIKDAWVFAGPDRLFVSAIIVINYHNLGRWAGQRKIAHSTFAELSQKLEVYGLIKNEIDRMNASLPSACRIRKYVNLHKEFDPDENEVTRNRNLRRPMLQERYQEVVRAIYSGKAEVSLQSEAQLQGGRTETKKTVLVVGSVEGEGS
jgi:long-chain acyl-CoA synthetase